MLATLARTLFPSQAPVRHYKINKSLNDESRNIFSKLYDIHFPEREVETKVVVNPFAESKRSPSKDLEWNIHSELGKYEEKENKLSSVKTSIEVNSVGEVKRDEPFPVVDSDQFHRFLLQNPIDVFLCDAKSLDKSGQYCPDDKNIMSQTLLGKMILQGSNDLISLIVDAFPEFTKTEKANDYIKFALSNNNYNAADFLINNNLKTLKTIAKTLDENRFTHLTSLYLERSNSHSFETLAVLLEIACQRGYVNTAKQICSNYPDLLTDKRVMSKAIILAIAPYTNGQSYETFAEAFLFSDPLLENRKHQIAEHLIEKMHRSVKLDTSCYNAAFDLFKFTSDQPKVYPAYLKLASRIKMQGISDTVSDTFSHNMFNSRDLRYTENDLISERKEHKVSII